MGYKKELKHRIADLLLEKEKNSKQTPFRCVRHPITGEYLAYPIPEKPREIRPEEFLIIDSPKEGYLSIMTYKRTIPYIERKLGMYGMIGEKGMCVPVGCFTRSAILQIHIVTEDDIDLL